MTSKESSIELLDYDNAEGLLAALRQIVNQDTEIEGPVRGVTVRCIKLAGHSDDEVRMWAAEALGMKVVPSPSEAIEIANCLAQPGDGEVAYWAATMLGRLGCDGIEGVAALIDCIEHSSFLPARERSAWALAQIGSGASQAIETLRLAVDENLPRLSRLANEAIREIERSKG